MKSQRKPAFYTEKKTFPQKLKYLMRYGKEVRVTQDELADYLKLRRQTVSQYLSGQSEPTFDNLVNIARFFGVSTDYLLTETTVKTVDPCLSSAVEYTRLSEEACLILRKMSPIESDCVDRLIRQENGVISSIAMYAYRPFSDKYFVFNDMDGVSVITEERITEPLNNYLKWAKENPHEDGYYHVILADKTIDNTLLDGVQNEVKSFRLSVVGNDPREISTEKWICQYQGEEREATNGEHQEN